MRWFFPAIIHRDERHQFYQNKFEYHQNVFRWVVILVTLAEISYFITDCQIFHHFAYETLFQRLFPLIFLAGFLIYNHYRKDYFCNILLSYLVMHACMWCTIWCIYYLPDREFSREGFLAMQFGFLCLGLAAPYYLSCILHPLMLVNLFLSNLWIHYEHFEMILTLGLPIMIGILLFLKILECTYVDHYLDKKTLEHLYIHDQLTLLYNRNILPEIVDSANNHLLPSLSQNTWFVLLDVDLFKTINDSYGHEIGDRILRQIALHIQHTTRACDYCIRWGGEEFVIILPGIAKEAALELAEKIRQTIATDDRMQPSTTVSIGLSQYKGYDFHQAIHEADKAMYYAKHNGRNQVVCFDELT